MKYRLLVLFLLIKSSYTYAQTKPVLNYDVLKEICSAYLKRIDSLSADNPAEYSRAMSVTLFQEKGVVKVLLRSNYDLPSPFWQGDMQVSNMFINAKAVPVYRRKGFELKFSDKFKLIPMTKKAEADALNAFEMAPPPPPASIDYRELYALINGKLKFEEMFFVKN